MPNKLISIIIVILLMLITLLGTSGCGAIARVLFKGTTKVADDVAQQAPRLIDDTVPIASKGLPDLVSNSTAIALREVPQHTADDVVSELVPLLDEFGPDVVAREAAFRAYINTLRDATVAIADDPLRQLTRPLTQDEAIRLVETELLPLGEEAAHLAARGIYGQAEGLAGRSVQEAGDESVLKKIFKEVLNECLEDKRDALIEDVVEYIADIDKEFEDHLTEPCFTA